jgi:hypothetical protein
MKVGREDISRPLYDAAVRRFRPLSFDPIVAATRNWESAGWTGAAEGVALVTSIMRAQQILLARVDQVLGPFGLTFARFETLMLLSFSRTGCLPLDKIGRRLQVHPASVTNAIGKRPRRVWCTEPHIRPTGEQRWRESLPRAVAWSARPPRR